MRAVLILEQQECDPVRGLRTLTRDHDAAERDLLAVSDTGELGGVDRAVDVAKRLAHIQASDSVRIVRLPEEKTFFQQLLEREKEQLNESRSLEATVQHILGLMEPIQARLPYELHIK